MRLIIKVGTAVGPVGFVTAFREVLPLPSSSKVIHIWEPGWKNSAGKNWAVINPTWSQVIDNLVQVAL